MTIHNVRLRIHPIALLDKIEIQEIVPLASTLNGKRVLENDVSSLE